MNNIPKVMITVDGKYKKDNTSRDALLQVTMNGEHQCIEIANGGDTYEIDSLIKSWGHSHNLNGIESSMVSIEFPELLNAIVALVLPATSYKLPWYVQVGLLLKSVEGK